jgi:SAM-dependent methyltransferase
MHGFKEFLTDPSVRSLIAHHALHPQSLDFAAAHRVKSLAPDDEFIISQYILGFGYFKDRLASVFESGDTFLDVGCGAGNWTIAAAFMFKHAIGIDIHKKRLSMAKLMASEFAPSCNILFLNSSAGKIPLRDASISATVCNNVMALINISHESFLLELRRVARKDCKLYLTLSDSGNLVWLCIQALRRPSIPRFLALRHVVARNILFSLRRRAQPYAWANETYITPLAAKCGWRLQHSGQEGAIMNYLQAPLFKSTFFGLPFMKEYILEAVS